MGNRREKREKKSRSEMKSKNTRDEAGEVKNRENEREREMRRKRSRSEDFNLKAEQLRSLTPPLNQLPGNLAIVPRPRVSSSRSASSSSSEGSPSGSESDSEAESSSHADSRKYNFESKTKNTKSMSCNRRCVQGGLVLFCFQFQETKSFFYHFFFLKGYSLNLRTLLLGAVARPVPRVAAGVGALIGETG